jgi:hypothetical protein
MRRAISLIVALGLTVTGAAGGAPAFCADLERLDANYRWVRAYC